MSGNEFNKIFAAVLVGGITVWLGGFVAEQSFHKKPLEKDAVTIEGTSEGGHGEAGAAAAPAVADPILGLIAAADVAKGAKISAACAACHSFEKGGPVKQGPNLWGVIGHVKGSSAGFDYSAGLKEKGGNWDYASLNQFLWKPKKFIGDTKMNFAGIKKPEDRAALIAWLRQQSDAQVALPTEAEIAAEAAAFAPPAPAATEGQPAEGTTPPADGSAPADGAKKEGDASAPAEPASDETKPEEKKAEEKPAH